MMRKLLAAAAVAAVISTPAQAFEIDILKPVLVAKINISTQRMHVFVGGKKKHTFVVSTGADGYRTPTGTFRPYRKHRHYWSRQYDNSPMHYALFFHRGYAVHATESTKYLGVPASYGCVRLHPRNAATLWKLVSKYGMGRTRFRLVGDWRDTVKRSRKLHRERVARNVGRFNKNLTSYEN